VEAATNRRRWWRGKRRSEIVGRPASIDEGDRREMLKRRRSRPLWLRWAYRYTGIFVYFLTLSLLVIAAAYAVPGATITLQPRVMPVEVSRQIVADPQLESVSRGGASVPGRILVSVKEWRAEVVPTSIVDVPDAPATGNVLFVNQSDQPVTIPAGTRVTTSAGTRIVFQTTSAAVAPPEVGATVEVEVVAIQPGPEGNVRVNQVNRIDGPLSVQLDVRNAEPLTGGVSRSERAVSEADHSRLRSQVLQQIQVLALGDMESQLTAQEFLARDSLRVRRIVHETYSHFPGEQTDLLILEIRAELHATAVDESQAISLVYETLADSVERDFELVPESLNFTSGEIIGVDGEGRVTFNMVGEGLMSARLNTNDLLDRITGQDVRVAQAYLYENLPLIDYPNIEVWPGWFGRVPYITTRIRTVTASVS
jgi:hypothetical protein